MDALVTGGTGFVGANLVRELLADGRTVRVLARKGGDRTALEGCAVEIVEGDLLDPSSLKAAVAGATARLPRRRRLPALGAGCARALSRQCGRHPPHPVGGRGGGRRAHRLHLDGRRPRHSQGRHAGRRDESGGARGHGGTVQGLQVPRRARRRGAGGARSADRHRQSLGADRALGRQAHADGADGRGLPHAARWSARSTRGSTSCTCATSPAATSWPPSAGGSVRSTCSAIATCPSSRSSGRSPASRACRAPRFRVPVRRGVARGRSAWRARPA